MKITDVTGQVDFGNNDDEYLPLTKCVCGRKFNPWEHSISIYKDDAKPCPACGRKMFFDIRVRVFQVEE